MKNYDERIESIFRKYNEKLEAKKRKTAVIRRIAFSTAGLCAAVIVCVFALKVPTDSFDYNYDNVIASTENVTDATSTAPIVSVIQTTATTAQSSPQEQTTTSSEQITTSVHSPISSVSTTAVTTAASKTDISATTSTVSETSTASRTESTAATTQTTATSSQSSQQEQTTKSSTTTITTTTNDGGSGGVITPPMGIPLIGYGGNTYLISKNRISPQKTGGVFAENLITTNPVDLSRTLANLAPIKGFSLNYAAAAQIDSEYYFCKAVNYQPQSLQSFFSDISLETNWDTEGYDYEYEYNNKDILFNLLLSIPDTVCVDSDYVGNEIYNANIYSDIDAALNLNISFTSRGYIIFRNGLYHDKYYIGEDKVSEIVSILENQ